MTAPATIEPADLPVEPVEDTPSDEGEMVVHFPLIVIEGYDTSDGRYLTPGSITPRALPLTLLAQTKKEHGSDQPPAAVTVGRIDTLERVPGPEVISKRTGEPFPEGTFVWRGTGAVSTTVEVDGSNIADFVRRRFLRGVSADLIPQDYEVAGEEGFEVDVDNPARRAVVHKGELGGATIVPLPAFGDCYVQLPDEGAAPAPITADELPAGLAASAFPAWRSAEVGDPVAVVAAAGEEHTGGMIALVPADPDALAVEGGEPADEIHLTLAYLGDDVTAWSEDERQAVLDHVRGWAADTAPIDADVVGWALFNPTGANDREPCAVHLASGDGLPDAKGAMRDHDASEHPVFLPHLTAGYGLPINALSFIGPIQFTKARVALGMDVVDFELGKPAADADRPDDDAPIVAAAPSAKERADAEDDGDTYPGTDRFPIDTRDRAASAVKLYGSSDLPAEKVKAWLIRRLKAKGWDDLIPNAWKGDGAHTAQPAEPEMPDEVGDPEMVNETGMPDAPQDCEQGDHAATRSLLYDDRRQYAATCDAHDEWAREQIAGLGFEVDEVVEIAQPADDTEEVPV